MQRDQRDRWPRAARDRGATPSAFIARSTSASSVLGVRARSTRASGRAGRRRAGARSTVSRSVAARASCCGERLASTRRTPRDCARATRRAAARTRRVRVRGQHAAHRARAARPPAPSSARTRPGASAPRTQGNVARCRRHAASSAASASRAARRPHLVQQQQHRLADPAEDLHLGLDVAGGGRRLGGVDQVQHDVGSRRARCGSPAGCCRTAGR